MKKHIFCTAALLLGATCASVAQEQTESVSFGVRVGYNVSSLLYSGPTLHKNDLSPKNGYHVGVVVDIKSSNKNFYFQPGLYFTKRGADYRCNAGIGYEYSLDLNYLQLPISVSYRPKVGKNVKLDINIAPYIAYSITGNMSGTEGDTRFSFNAFGKSTTNIDDYTEVRGDLSRVDCGFRFGIGACVRRFYIGLQYELGIVNLAESGEGRIWAEDDRLLNGAFSLTLGYNF